MIKVDMRSKEDIRNSLIALCEFDEDMNGSNGEDFTWIRALEEGYTTSAEYLADKVMRACGLYDRNYKTPDVKKVFRQFALEFYEGNCDYYSECPIDILADGDFLYVSFIAIRGEI